MSFSETIFLFILALVIFGPKKLPEIARQAGRLLAELRRASNEFKSQIETEIAHLEVEKKYPSLPPSGPPQGAVASLNPAASEVLPPESGITSATPTETAVPLANSATQNSAGSSSVTSPTAAVANTECVPASQDSHV
ncbi:MAG: twin-arginine translocase TatA/TatE family subunit [Candidatus Sulfotelmatobacter sp.]